MYRTEEDMNNLNFEIDLKKMLYNVLKKWKTIIVLMIIFAVLSNLIYIYKNKMLDSTLEDNYQKALTDKEIDEVNYAHESYELYEAQYNQKNQYLNESEKMKLQYNNVNNYTLQYRVEKSDVNGVVDAIISAYVSGIKNDELFKIVENKTNNRIQSKYVSELINVWKNNSSVNIEKDLDIDVININVIAGNKEDCDNIVDCVKKRIDEIYNDTKVIYVNYSIVPVLEDYSINVDLNLRDEQNELKASINTLKKNMISVTKSFTDKQLEYYNFKYKDNDKSDAFISIKFIVLGLGIGFVMAALFLALKYIWSYKLKSSNDLKMGWNIELINSVLIDEKHNVLSKLMWSNDNIKTYEEQVNYLSMEIKMLIKDDNRYKNLLITGTADTIESKKLIKSIKDNISFENINIVTCQSIIDSAQSLTLLDSVDGVIFVEEIMQSSYNNIDKEIQLCRRLDKQIIGAVVISD